jgi:hypothetical protein
MCLRASDCIIKDSPYCLQFQGDAGEGTDLGTVVFHRRVTEDDPASWNVELRGDHPTWAIATAITNVNERQPILSASGTFCDVDSESVFPSVYGEENNVLLLSQSFDDSALNNKFLPPNGTSLLGWTEMR